MTELSLEPYVFPHFDLQFSSVQLLSCVWLCDPMDCSLPGSSVHGILQARILEWVAMPSSRGSSQPRDRTQVFYTAGRFFTTEPPEKPNTCVCDTWQQWPPNDHEYTHTQILAAKYYLSLRGSKLHWTDGWSQESTKCAWNILFR